MRCYNALQGHIGRRFVQRLVAEFDGVRSIGCKYERPLVFAAVVFPMKENRRSSKDICAFI